MNVHPIASRLYTPLATLLAAGLLAACATPDAIGPGSDTVSRHALVRTAPPAPEWSALRDRLAAATGGKPGVEIGAANVGGFRVQIPVADGFTSGSTTIRPALLNVLDVLAVPLAGEPGVAIRVIGHTDSQGSEMVNLRLSIARAEAVVTHLRDRGIALERLSADGRGEADPLTANATEEGRVRNRRVELILSRLP
ncbi:OmpA family protein [Thauera sp.]|jgi:outer membrane protein OmpA-like peptidoglycan-associated protein|uniref:OmpA family protein n=1 Tax=Thauera sp. TaxID=1905334 RepID=UPI0026018CA5|nr:OmpA family protein [Thauera sp.]MCK6410095.1 OmpA family protein [Thauera sp.]